jgi:DNA repair protein RadC
LSIIIPSGNLDPRPGDRDLTRGLVYAGKAMRIKVLDHLIIGDYRHFSSADTGLIDECERDYLNLKLRGNSEARRRLYIN